MPNFNGKLIAVTRPEERSQAAVDIIESYGGTALVVPTLELRPSRTPSLMDLCRRASELDWIIFTSPASLESLFKYCSDFKKNLNPNCRVATIGPRTGRLLGTYGLKSDLIPDNYTAEGLLDLFLEFDLKDKKVGLPRTFSARDVLPQGLEERGARVYLAEAYKSTLPHDKNRALQLVNMIIEGQVDAVTFTSPLTVENLIKIASNKKKAMIKSLKSGEVLVAAIGPITGAVLEENGIPYISPKEYTVKAMLERLLEEMNLER